MEASSPTRRPLPPEERRSAALRLALFLAGFYAAWTLRATWLYAADERIASPALRAVHACFVKAVLWIVPAAIFTQRWKQMRPTACFALGRSPRRAYWGRCLLATGAFLALVAAAELGLGGKSLSIAALGSPPWIPALLAVGVTPLLEELFFRGFVLREFLELLPSARANLLASLLFVAAHLPYWLSHGGLTMAVARDCAGVFVFSLLAGWLFVVSRSVWPPTLAHVGNNLLSSLLAASAS